MGPRSDFSKPCQGAAEKSANATRCCCLARGSQRIGMSIKKDAARPFGLGTFFVVAVQDENWDKQRQGIIVVMVSCLLLILTVYGILGLVQQIGICRGSINPLSQSLAALPALPKGELFAADGKHP